MFPDWFLLEISTLVCEFYMKQKGLTNPTTELFGESLTFWKDIEDEMIENGMTWVRIESEKQIQFL